MTVYVLSWNHRFVESGIVVIDTTFLGVYSSKEMLEKAKEKFSTEMTAYCPYCNEDVTEWGKFVTDVSIVDSWCGMELT